MDRRMLIKRSALGLLGLGLAGCATPRAGLVTALDPTRRLVRVRASWDRVIRTTVGLRPYRPSGFVLRTSKLDDKTVIQNYGHGGSGMSLSWGTGEIAANMAIEKGGRSAAVLGC